MDFDIPSESDEDMFPNEEANTMELAINIAGGTTNAQDEDDSWLNELQTQPQSPSSPLRVRVDGEKQEIPPPGQMEGLEGMATLFIEQATKALDVITGRILAGFMGRMVRETTKVVAVEGNKDEPTYEAPVTKRKSLGHEPVAEPTPCED